MNKSVQIELNKIIKEYKWNNVEDIDWFYISYSQKLSEKFIREFQDKLDWHWISIHQKLSEDFIREFKDKLDLTHLLMYKEITQKFYNELTDGKPPTRSQLLDFS